MKKGFTLLEVIIVLIILAIVAGFAVPSFTGLSTERLVKNTATDLAIFLNNSRMCAKGSGNEATVTLTGQATENNPFVFALTCTTKDGVDMAPNFVNPATLQIDSDLNLTGLAQNGTLSYPARGLVNFVDLTLQDNGLSPTFVCTISFSALGLAEVSCQ